MENNNNNSSDASQWSVFKSQHCRIWFGVAQQFDSTGKTTDVFRVMHSYKPRLNSVDGSEIEHSNVYYYDDDRGTVTSSEFEKKTFIWLQLVGLFIFKLLYHGYFCAETSIKVFASVVHCTIQLFCKINFFAELVSASRCRLCFCFVSIVPLLN